VEDPELFCDCDRFKAVNDTYGHQAGDAVPQAMAEVMLLQPLNRLW
jgi:diguanylate cyclase (GGDEF)-like protein